MCRVHKHNAVTIEYRQIVDSTLFDVDVFVWDILNALLNWNALIADDITVTISTWVHLKSSIEMMHLAMCLSFVQLLLKLQANIECHWNMLQTLMLACLIESNLQMQLK